MVGTCMMTANGETKSWLRSTCGAEHALLLMPASLRAPLVCLRSYVRIGEPENYYYYMKNWKLPIPNQSRRNLEVTISGKRCILGHLKTILVVLWGDQDTLIVVQYSGSDSRRKKHICYYHRLHFRFFIILIYQDMVPVAAFPVFCFWTGI